MARFSCRIFAVFLYGGIHIAGIGIYNGPISSSLRKTLRAVSTIFVGAHGHRSYLDPNMRFVMLTPIQWNVVGGAIVRRVEEGCTSAPLPTTPACDIDPLVVCPLDIYVDDTFGAGRPDRLVIEWFLSLRMFSHQALLSLRKIVSSLPPRMSSAAMWTASRRLSARKTGLSTSSFSSSLASVAQIRNR